MGNIIVSGAAVRMAGANVSLTIPELAWTEWISGAEAFLNMATRFNFSDNFATLNDDVKFTVSDTVSRLVADNAIIYDMSGYTSRQEGEDIITEHRARIEDNIMKLNERKHQDFVKGA